MSLSARIGIGFLVGLVVFTFVLLTLMSTCSPRTTPIGTTTTTIGTQDAGGASRGIQVGIGNGVELEADTDATDTSFLAFGKHTQGDTYYMVDGDSTAVYFDQLLGSAGESLTANGYAAFASTTADDPALVANAAASPSANGWTVK